MAGIISLVNPKAFKTSSETWFWGKSQKIPSERPEAVVVISPVSFIARKSPGSIILSHFSKTSGSFSFTQANLAAVKLPGELSNEPRAFSLPMASNALSPYFIALLSHQMMECRNTF